MKLVDFWENKPTVEEIDEYYNQTLALIDKRFCKTANQNYDTEFAMLTDQEVGAMHKHQTIELSIEVSLILLAYIESMFRTDLVKRLENRKSSDNLSKFYRSQYNPAKKVYQIGLDVIFEGWKNYYGNISNPMRDIINTLPQYFDYRNWVAHGRYWRFRESNYEKKYNYPSIKMLLDRINAEFYGKLKS